MPDQFCENCAAESTSESVGDIKEGMFGREFMGEARRCEKCSSYVTVLWRVFLYFPAKAEGCYRYKMVGVHFGGVDFISRRVPDDPVLIRQTRLKGILIAAVLFAAAIGLILFNRARG